MRQYVLKQGDAGQEVVRLQIALGIACDGKFGPATAAKVAQFQAAHGLDVDAAVGPAVYAALGVPEPIPGIDVSKWQGKIDWARAAASGAKFAYVRASQGDGYTDPLELVDVAGAAAQGLPVGLYAFCTPDKDAATVAAHFCDVMDATPGETLRPMMDLETSGGLSATTLVAWADLFINTLVNRGYPVPLLYTNLSVLALLKAGGFVPRTGCGLWIARYDGQVDDPDVDTAPFHGWTLWQYSETGAVDGIDGNVDLDWLVGGAIALNALAVVQP